MLVGLTIPSSGQLLTLSKHNNVIGLCPQFDILYDDLTVEEHLLFYVRLKAQFNAKTEAKQVQAIIDEVRFILLSILSSALTCTLGWFVK
jgi:ABC-type multidrug transport system ATPase subunit